LFDHGSLPEEKDGDEFLADLRDGRPVVFRPAAGLGGLSP